MRRIIVLLFALTFVVASPVYAQDGAAEDQYVGGEGEGCTTVGGLEGNTSKTSQSFNVNNTTVLITYETEPLNNRGFNSTDIYLVDAETFTQINSVEAFEGEDGQLSVPVEKGRYQVETSTFEQAYEIIVQVRGGDDECLEVDGPGGGGENPQPNPPEPPFVPEPPEGPGKIILPKDLEGKKLADTGGLSPIAGMGLVAVATGLIGLGILRRN